MKNAIPDRWWLVAGALAVSAPPGAAAQEVTAEQVVGAMEATFGITPWRAPQSHQG